MLNALGKITVAAAGTPVQAYTGSTMARYNTVLVQADPANAGKVYLGTSAAMDAATRAGVVLALTAGQMLLIGPGGAGVPFDAANLWVDADDNGDGLIVTLLQ